jgi:hypothetical protein
MPGDTNACRKQQCKSKTEAMFFPDSLKEAKALASIKTLPTNLTLPNNKDAEIRTHIKKARFAMGIAKHFFSNKDVDIRMKHNIYNAFVISYPMGL